MLRWMLSAAMERPGPGRGGRTCAVISGEGTLIRVREPATREHATRLEGLAKAPTEEELGGSGALPGRGCELERKPTALSIAESSGTARPSNCRQHGTRSWSWEPRCQPSCRHRRWSGAACRSGLRYRPTCHVEVVDGRVDIRQVREVVVEVGLQRQPPAQPASRDLVNHLRVVDRLRSQFRLVLRIEQAEEPGRPGLRGIVGRAEQGSPPSARREGWTAVGRGSGRRDLVGRGRRFKGDAFVEFD